MATLTVIVGYCCSGKSTVQTRLAAACPGARVMDEGLALPQNERDHRERAAVFQALRDSRPAIVTSLECANERNRDIVMQQVLAEAPGTQFLWLFFENDVARANENCRRDPNRQADVDGYIRINNRSAVSYSIPGGAIILKMFELPDT